MYSFRKIPLVIGLAVLALALSLSRTEAAGPWRAQIIDAETGQPLEGVVVLAYWIKYTESLAGTAGGEFYDAEEVVTGPDGRFVIQARSTWTLNPFRRISRVQFVIFKPGYGQWRFQGSRAWPQDVVEQKAYVKKAWEQFEGEGVVIELPLLKTPDERLRFLDSVSWAPVVPLDYTKRLQQVIDKERVYLGLPKMYERKP